MNYLVTMNVHDRLLFVDTSQRRETPEIKRERVDEYTTRFTLVDTAGRVSVSEEAEAFLREHAVAESDEGSTSLSWKLENGVWVLTWYGGEGTLFSHDSSPLGLGTVIDRRAFASVKNVTDFDMHHGAQEYWRQRGTQEI